MFKINLGECGASAYEDKGCNWFPKCTECPLPKCRYETSINQDTAKRYIQMQSLFRDHELTYREIAATTGVSFRTVTRYAHRLQEGA